MRAELVRRASTYMGTFGYLTLYDQDNQPVFSCWTVEKPWENNRPYMSCIPTGRYTVKRSWFNRGDYEVFEIVMPKDSPRSHILIHKANVPSDVWGCIGLGERLGVLGNEWAVLNSRKAFDTVMDELKWVDEFKLEIR